MSRLTRELLPVGIMLGLFLLQPPATMGQLSKEERKRVEAVEKTSDQSKLLQFVTTDTSDQVRLRAIRKITDQPSLAAIAKSQLDVRYEALERLSDQTLLADVALNAEDKSNLTSKAVEKITDQLLLAKIAKTVMYAGYVGGFAAKTAVERITDQMVLLDVAQNAADFFIRGEAIKKLSPDTVATRQEAIVQIALTDKPKTQPCQESIHSASAVAVAHSS